MLKQNSRLSACRKCDCLGLGRLECERNPTTIKYLLVTKYKGRLVFPFEREKSFQTNNKILNTTGRLVFYINRKLHVEPRTVNRRSIQWQSALCLRFKWQRVVRFVAVRNFPLACTAHTHTHTGRRGGQAYTRGIRLANVRLCSVWPWSEALGVWAV